MYQHFKNKNLIIRYIFTFGLLFSLVTTNMSRAYAAPLDLRYCDDADADAREARFEDPNLLDIVCVTVRLINVSVLFSGVALVATFCYGTIKIAFSIGDPKGIQAGRTVLLLSLVGFLIVLGFNTINRVLVATFGLSPNYAEPDTIAALILNGICNLLTKSADKPIVEIPACSP